MAASSESNPEVLGQFLEAMERLDYDTPLKLASPDCESDNPPPIGTVHGPAAIRGVLEPFFAAAHENEFKILRKARTDGSSCR